MATSSAQRTARTRTLDFVACLLACALLAVIAPGPQAELYPMDWLPGTLPILGPVLLLLAVLGPRHAWIWGVVGLLLGGILGHLIGEPVYQHRLTEYQSRSSQDVMEFPLHPGWWIALLTFAVCVVAGVMVQSRMSRGE